MDPISEQIAQALESLLVDREFRLPIHFAMIAVDGSLLTGTYSQKQDELQASFNSQYFANPERTLLAPLNIIFVDARGDALRVRVTDEQRPGVPELY